MSRIWGGASRQVRVIHSWIACRVRCAPGSDGSSMWPWSESSSILSSVGTPAAVAMGPSHVVRFDWLCVHLSTALPRSSG